MATKNTEKNSKDGLALVVGGIFILSLVFATYNYFNKGSDLRKLEEIENEKIFEDSDEPTEGDLNGPGASTETGQTSSTGTSATVSDETWVANKYSAGDIKSGTYEVTSGDTLWEIAEAAYGNGADWVKILEANRSSIGFLADGTQALIIPGQVLVLP